MIAAKDRNRIRELSGVMDMFDIPGLTELYGPGTGLECFKHEGIHYWADYYILEIIDPDSLEPVAPGEMGEIVTRSDIVMKGYWRNPDATVKTLRNGWLHTGDVGYADEGGYIFIMDRSKDMIISGGENIYPREIEEVLIQHRDVREVAVIGVPDEKWGESIKAVVSLNPGHTVTEEELISFCKENIASFKKPKSIDFVDELPKNNYGKILKRELRAKYWEDRERKV